jgi:L-aminopeptidase/D-esterase-like protein
MTTNNNTLTAIDGIRVGHVTDADGVTGCTVILCPDGTVGGVDQRGGAPGTRETDLLRPMHMVQHANAVVLTGGSAFGLAAADGVMRYLREQGMGFRAGPGIVVPIVPAAVLFDLQVGSPVHPTADDGYAAAQAASPDPVKSGSLGAGTGATVGKLAGMTRATKGGLGSAAAHLPNGLIVAALFAVNCVGDVIGPDGAIRAGLRSDNGAGFVSTLAMMTKGASQSPLGNTVIGVVATNAALTKEMANKVAQMAHDGLARAVSPAHTLYDGDTIFALATGKVEADVNLVGAFAAEVTAGAIRAGVQTATALGGVPAANL